MTVELVVRVLRSAHIVLAFAGLGLFWIAVLARKGSRLHIRTGRAFAACAYFVAVTAIASCASTVLDPPGTLRRRGERALTEAALLDARMGALFLGYLALVLLATTFHGVSAARTHGRPGPRRRAVAIGFAVSAVLGGIASLAAGVLAESSLRPLLLALSPVGPLIGHGQLRWLRSAESSRSHWQLEHMGAMLVSGITFNTGALIFGTQLLGIAPTGMLGVVPWLLPTVVGVPVMAWWLGRERRRLATGLPRGACA